MPQAGFKPMVSVSKRSSPTSRCISGVVVSVLATGPKGHGFKPGHGDGFFNGDKNPEHAFLWIGSKARVPMS
jgi:hypothetical protein